MIEKNMLKAKLTAAGETQAQLADFLGVSKATLNAKLNGVREFSRLEVESIAMRYQMDKDEVSEIFFPRLSTITK